MFEIITLYTTLTVAALFFLFASLAGLLAEPFLDSSRKA